MSEHVKAAVIVALAIIISTGIAVYFGNFQTCMRDTDGAMGCYFMMR